MEKPLSIALIEDTPFGAMVVAASSAGLAYMSFHGLSDFQTLISDSTNISNSGSLNIVQEAIRQVQEYFARQRQVFDLPLDLQNVTDFQRSVLSETARIPYGRTLTYGELADRINNPKAARAVGGALARNPLVLVIPCHRVVAGDGSMHGFSSPGGIAAKAALLELEGCRVKNNKLVG